jgi:hypothetical protein
LLHKCKVDVQFLRTIIFERYSEFLTTLALLNDQRDDLLIKLVYVELFLANEVRYFNPAS